MDYDKFKRAVDEELKSLGTSTTELADRCVAKASEGSKPIKPGTDPSQIERLKQTGAPDSIVECVKEMLEKTEDETVEQVMARALGLYRRAVRHIASKEGVVRFVYNDATFKTLKLPVKK